MKLLSGRTRYAIFSLIFFLLMLVVVVVALEVAVPLIFGKWWPSINIVSNPDHRMTQVMNNDVNSDGVRSGSEANEFREEDFNIIVLGDSFVFGMFSRAPHVARTATLGFPWGHMGPPKYRGLCFVF